MICSTTKPPKTCWTQTKIGGLGRGFSFSKEAFSGSIREKATYSLKIDMWKLKIIISKIHLPWKTGELPFSGSTVLPISFSKGMIWIYYLVVPLELRIKCLVKGYNHWLVSIRGIARMASKYG